MASEGALSRRPGYFSIYGLDILVDARMHTYFGEMNFSPDLSDGNSGQWKRRMQRRMLREALLLQHEVLHHRAFGSTPDGAPLVSRLRDVAVRQTGWRPVGLSEVVDADRIRWVHAGALDGT